MPDSRTALQRLSQALDVLMDVPAGSALVDGVFFPSVIRRSPEEWKEIFAAERIKTTALPAEPSSDKQRRRHRKPRVPPPDGLRTADEAAAKLGCSIKTLKAHVDAGELKYVVIGRGTKRPRRYFTDGDLVAFIAAQTREASPCPYDATHAPRSGSTISKSTVIAFSARPRKPTSAKPKR